MSDESDLFPGFATHRIVHDGVTLHARVGGSGPPLVLLHGYPQTHVCWHRVAPRLAETHTVVVMDLRGRRLVGSRRRRAGRCGPRGLCQAHHGARRRCGHGRARPRPICGDGS